MLWWLVQILFFNLFTESRGHKTTTGRSWWWVLHYVSVSVSRRPPSAEVPMGFVAGVGPPFRRKIPCNGNDFHIIGSIWGESTGNRLIPPKGTVMRSFDVFVVGLKTIGLLVITVTPMSRHNNVPITRVVSRFVLIWIFYRCLELFIDLVIKNTWSGCYH